MKTLLIALVLTTSAFAREIKGTLLLSGSLKTDVVVSRVKSTCKISIERKDISNLTAPLESIDPAIEGSEMKNYIEDSFGNPAYQVIVGVSVEGTDFARSRSVRYNTKLVLNNMYQVGDQKQVEDLTYHSVDNTAFMNIDDEGRIVNVKFSIRGEAVNCSF